MSTSNDGVPASVNMSSEIGKHPSVVRTTKEPETTQTLIISDVNFFHTLLASGEKVLLQAAMVTVCGDTESRASVVTC